LVAVVCESALHTLMASAASKYDFFNMFILFF